MLRACPRSPGAPRWPMKAGYPIVKSPVSFAATGQPMVLVPMQRRDFITLLGAPAASPLLLPRAARAQEGERVRRVRGVFWGGESDAGGQGGFAEVWKNLAQAG